MVRYAQWPGLDALLTYVPVSDAVKVDLITMMSEECRCYHGIPHLTTLWRRHQTNATKSDFASPRATRLIACSIAFHDCVYDGYRNDNEDRSASYWLDVSREADIDDYDRHWVAETIRLTKDHLAYPQSTADACDADSSLRLWMLDLDLTPLGELPDDFDRNTRLLRQEVRDLDDAAFEQNVRRFLMGFDAAPRIYRSNVLANIYEAAARRNIARRLGQSEGSPR